MKRTGDIYLIIIIGLLLGAAMGMTSCGDGSSRKVQRAALARAEALMESDPHAARAVLDSLGPHPIPPLKGREADHPSFRRGKGEAALYALLRTQADYKCRVRLTSDSLPLIATRYYGTKRKTRYAALSQYYLGCAYSDMHRDLDAIDALLRATTLFPDTTDKYFANSLIELGSLYMNHQMNDEAMSVFKRFRISTACKKDSVNIGFADYYMGMVSLFEGMDLQADSLFQLASRNTKLPKRTHEDIFFQLAKLYYYHLNQPKEALKYINSYIETHKEGGAASLLHAEILSNEGDFSLAYESYTQALERSIDVYTSCMAYKGLSTIAQYVQKSDSILSFINHYTALLDTIYAKGKQKEISDIKNNHIIEIHDQQLKARHVRFIFWGGLFFVVAFSVFAISLLLIDRRRKNEKLKFEQELHNIKQRQIDQKVNDEEQTNNTPGTSSFQQLFAIQQERVDLYRKQFVASRWHKYLAEHTLVIQSKEKVMPTKEMSEFNSYLHGLFADVFLDLVNDNAKVTHLTLEFIAMKLLEFDTEHIAYCSQSNIHAVHNRRYYLKEKLTPEWYSFVMGKYNR